MIGKNKKNRGILRRIGRWIKYHYLKILRIDDTPEKIAFGAAIGVTMGVLPTFGLGIPLSILFAIILRANRVSAVIGSAIVNPWTAPIFWGASYFIGSLILGQKGAETLKDISNLRASGQWSTVLGKDIFLPYIIGNIAVAAFFAIISYFISYKLVQAYRRVKIKRVLLQSSCDKQRHFND